MPIYNKLIRDKIPKIIAEDGKEYTTRVLNENEFEIELIRKLKEEISELDQTEKLQEKNEELADLLEILHSLAELYNTDFDEIEEIRRQKRAKRGGFDKRIFLIDVED